MITEMQRRLIDAAVRELKDEPRAESILNEYVENRNEIGSRPIHTSKRSMRVIRHYDNMLRNER